MNHPLEPGNDYEFKAIDNRIVLAARRYGPLASTHEALGVALEEWNELCGAVQVNDLAATAGEALDLAAVCIRLATAIRCDPVMQARSVK